MSNDQDDKKKKLTDEEADKKIGNACVGLILAMAFAIAVAAMAKSDCVGKDEPACHKNHRVTRYPYF